MTFSKKKFALFYLILLSLSIYTPKYGTLDRMSVQFFLLSLTNFIAIISFPFIFSFSKSKLKELLRSKLIIAYGGVVLISILSLIKSINIIESLVKLNQLFVFLISLIILIFLSTQKYLSKRNILWVVFISLIVDVAFSLYPFYELIRNDIDYQYSFVTNFVGLAGNRNILALSILFRIPLVIYFAFITKNKIFKILIFITSIISFFNIYVLSSRAALLGVILSVVFSVFLILVKKVSNVNKEVRHLALFLIIPIIISLIISSSVTAPSDRADVGNRVTSIVNDNDESINSRYRFWSHALDFISENPLLGGGIGTWKIYSIKYDAANIKSYIVPYSAHNDFLEYTAETGIFGGLMFLSFFIILFWIILKAIRFKNFDFDFMLTFALLLPFLIYFIDLNLNFPSSRPLNIFLLLLFISLTTLISKERNENI